MKFKGSQALKILVILYTHVLWDGLGGQLVKLASHKGIAITYVEYITGSAMHTTFTPYLAPQSKVVGMS